MGLKNNEKLNSREEFNIRKSALNFITRRETFLSDFYNEARKNTINR